MEVIKNAIWVMVGFLVAFLLMLVVFGFYFAVGVAIAVFGIKVGILPTHIGNDIPTTLVVGSIVMVIGVLALVHYHTLKKIEEEKNGSK